MEHGPYVLSSSHLICRLIRLGETLILSHFLQIRSLRTAKEVKRPVIPL